MVRVVDGDTIHVLVDGRREKVRYIGVDTPERGDCFHDRATAANAALVAGRAVRLERDVEERDRYGRLLAYVFRRSDDLFVNAELVRRGFAAQLTVPPNVRFAERFGRLSRAARRRGSGLWAQCR